MAYVNFKNSPSEETPLTGGATGNLNVMQENGTSHGADTKLGYAQSFLNEHIINVSNEVDEDYRVNFIKGKNLFDKANVLNAYINAGTSQLASDGSFRTVYIKVKPNTTYTIQKILSNRFVLGFSSDSNLTLPKTLNSVWQENNATQKTITSTSTANYLFICVSKTSEDTVALEDILNSLQVEEGNTATSYEPYITPSIYVDGEEIYSKEEPETVDISSYKTNNVSIITRANMTKIGHIVKINIAVTNTSISSSTHLFDNLPFKPKEITELNSVNNSNQSTRCFIDTTGNIIIATAQATAYYINGIIIV